jgi:AraC-like DNA-binding protein
MVHAPKNSVAVLVRDPKVRATLTHKLSGRVQVRECGTVHRLLELLRNTRVSAVVTDLRGTGGTHADGMIHTLRERYPSLPIICVAQPTQGELRELLRAARAGITDVIVPGVSDVGEVVGHALSPPDRERAMASVLSAVTALAPAASRPILEYCVRHAKLGFSAKQLSGAMAVSRSTLGRRMADAGLPSPGALLTWSRLLTASYLLEDGSRTVADVARAVGFTSEIALRRSLKRVAGFRPSELQHPGAGRAMVMRFSRQMLLASNSRAR